MKFPSSLLLLGLVLPACGQPYFVAPAGNDTSPGTLERPFASLGRAQEAVRQKPGSVWLRGGIYYLPQKLVFTAQDSGTKAAPVIYQASGSEHPVISGGVKLEKLDWHSIHAAGQILHHDLPASDVPGRSSLPVQLQRLRPARRLRWPSLARPLLARGASVSNGKWSNETQFAAQGRQWRHSIGYVPKAAAGLRFGHLVTFAWAGGCNASIASARLRR